MGVESPVVAQRTVLYSVRVQRKQRRSDKKTERMRVAVMADGRTFYDTVSTCEAKHLLFSATRLKADEAFLV
jgi:hypothetical protein